MKVRLVNNGVFPVLMDKEGHRVNHVPMTGFDFSGTFQGEGKLTGIPSIFIRFSGCNLRCVWQAFDGSISICDTPYSSHQAHSFTEMEVEDIVKTVAQNLNGIKHVVITGGEPTLQATALVSLAGELKKLGLHITIETNGVLFIPELIKHIDLFSISPKLSSTVPTREKIKLMTEPIDESFEQWQESRRKNLDVLQQHINACYFSDSYYGDNAEKTFKRRPDKDFQLKFVVGRPEDEAEIKNEYLSKLSRVTSGDVLIMPLGGTREFISKTYRIAAEMAVRNRWRLTPRLHIDLFNDTQWV